MNGTKATCALSPFDSQLRTLVGAARKSHSCPQKRTHAPQQTITIKIERQIWKHLRHDDERRRSWHVQGVDSPALPPPSCSSYITGEILPIVGGYSG
jgi:hypothetical protein